MSNIDETTGFRVTLEHQFQLDAYAIWFTSGEWIIRLDPTSGTGRTVEKFDPGTKPDPSLIIPGELLAKLVAEASDVLPPSAALQRHLSDTMTVRDRLLTLVEKAADR
jgi:hypothetical protein